MLVSCASSQENSQLRAEVASSTWEAGFEWRGSQCLEVFLFEQSQVSLCPRLTLT